jgi:hypothetical protein
MVAKTFSVERLSAERRCEPLQNPLNSSISAIRFTMRGVMTLLYLAGFIKNWKGSKLEIYILISIFIQ